jgi:hypothetical protein
MFGNNYFGNTQYGNNKVLGQGYNSGTLNELKIFIPGDIIDGDMIYDSPDGDMVDLDSFPAGDASFSSDY